MAKIKYAPPPEVAPGVYLLGRQTRRIWNLGDWLILAVWIALGVGLVSVLAQ